MNKDLEVEAATKNWPGNTQPAHYASGFIGLSDLLEIIKRNLITLLGLPLIGLLLGAFIAVKAPRIYVATALLQLDPKPTVAIREIQDPYQPGYGTEKYYNTQLHVLGSRKLSEKLARRLELQLLDEFSGVKPGLISRIRNLSRWLPFLPPAQEKKLSEELVWEIVVARTQAATNVAIVRETNLFKVRFSSLDPDLAARAANSLADIYIEELLQAKLDVTKKATFWLNKNLNEISNALNDAEDALQQYRSSADIVETGGVRNIVQEDLLDASKRLREVQKTRLSLQNLYAEINRAGNSPEALGEVSALLVDPVVKSAADNYFQAQDEVRKLEKRYGSRHPQMATAEARLERAKKTYFDQLRFKAQGAKSEYEIALKDEQELKRQVEQAKKKVQQIESKQYELGVLQREVETNKQLYDLFLSRFKETSSTTSYDQVNARIADPAVTPRAPSRPRKNLLIASGFMFGALLALLVVVLREALRSSIETVHDIEKITSIAVISVLPRMPRSGQKSAAAHWLAGEPKSPFADAIRSVRAALVLSDIDRKIKTIAVTSPLPSEGKSTICSTLATTLAHNEKVLVIDADLRRPSLNKMFGLPKNAVGLTQFLGGHSSLEEVIQKDEKTGVYTLPAGSTPANPAQLLTSNAFRDLLNKLAGEFDRIFIDTPPCGATSDALQIGPLMDGYLLVARSEKTPTRALAGALKQLSIINANLLGIVLNDSSVSLSHGSYGYGYYGNVGYSSKY